MTQTESSTEGSATGRSGPRSRKKLRILSQAAALFAERGYHATGMAEVCEVTGIGRGALYHHIGSKEQLLFEISSTYLDPIIEQAVALQVAEMEAEERVRRLARDLMRTMADHLAEWTVFFREVSALTGERRRIVFELRERYEALWLDALRVGVEAGRFRTAEPLVVKGIIGMFGYSYLWYKPGGDKSPDEIADMFSEVILAGVLQ